MSGWVTFVMGSREMAGALDEVREVVRATGLEELSGTRAPVTGLLELRGTPVPVVDLRSGTDPADEGDILVLTTPQGVLGLAVDRVSSVLGPDDLVAPGPDEPCPHGLPAYVLEVRRDPAGRPVLVVSLTALAGLVSA
jgi:purine-binding chemotaxis protein CheW